MAGSRARGAGGEGRRGPFDPRLLHYAAATRRYLGLSVVLGTIATSLLVVQAWILASVLAGVIAGHESLHTCAPRLGFLAAAICLRGLVAYLAERSAHGASAEAKSQLRVAVVDHLVAPGCGADVDAAKVALGATVGLDALDGYFARYLPQVFLAVAAPSAVVVAICGIDWLSGIIVAVTVPLIPLFMILVGLRTGELIGARQGRLDALGRQFLDAVVALPTLKVFGRAQVQARAMQQAGDQYRSATMDTLRLAFLSSLVLELLATVSVALVAVAIGLRLLAGALTLDAAFFVLLLAPEAYVPLRNLGASYHASADGVAAADRLFEILEQPLAEPRGTSGARVASVGRLEVVDLSVQRGAGAAKVLDRVNLSVDPGEVLAITGCSGVGKTTLLSCLLSMTEPTSGVVLVDGVPLSVLDRSWWFEQVAWVPQRPHLFAGTIADNVALGRQGASWGAITQAIDDAGLTSVVESLPDGPWTVIGETGVGLSVGERQRVALARAFLRDAPLLLLDEPTAALDGATEAVVLAAIGRLVERRTTVMVAHRPSLVRLATRVVELEPASTVAR